MQKSEGKGVSDSFHNDVFFKYMLIGEDAGSAMLRSRIIEEIYGLKVQKTQVLVGAPAGSLFRKTSGSGCCIGG